MALRGRASRHFGTASSKGNDMLNAGDNAPSITVTATDGSSVNLASPGQPLVLYFYPKDDTSGCTREAQDFTALAGDYAKAGVKVIGVSRDPMKSHEKFIGKYGLAVPLASDEDGRISEAFGTWVQKSMYGRKYMGMERATYLIGADGRVLKAWRKVKVPNHAQDVLASARALAPA
jgi:peroxiredoxin Q/BCP